jgi:hypothetical protein
VRRGRFQNGPTAVSSFPSRGDSVEPSTVLSMRPLGTCHQVPALQKWLFQKGVQSRAAGWPAPSSGLLGERTGGVQRRSGELPPE